MVMAATSYLFYKFKSMYNEYRLRRLQCDNVYDQLVNTRRITPTPQRPSNTTRSRFENFKQAIQTKTSSNKTDKFSGLERLKKKIVSFTSKTNVDNNITTERPYVTSLHFGPRRALFVSDSPSLPNLYALQDHQGNVRIEPLHAPVDSQPEYDFPMHLDSGRTPTSRRHPIRSTLHRQPTLELQPTNEDTNIVEIHDLLTRSDSTSDLNSNNLTDFKDMTGSNEILEELPLQESNIQSENEDVDLNKTTQV